MSRRLASADHCHLLTPAQLVSDFGPRSPLAREAISKLTAHLDAAGQPSLSSTWQRVSTQNAVSARTGAGLRRLAGWFELSPGPNVYLAAEAYYALIVRGLIGLLTSGSRRNCCDASLEASLGQHEGQALEGLKQWKEALAARLSRYRRDVSREADAPCDLLKPLYQALFPRELRHAGGEFYTPDWLARHVVDQVGYRGDLGQRLLDPACGSGTFLVQAIWRVRRFGWPVKPTASGSDPDRAQRAQAILAAVQGFELNPLAALSARANYLFAMGDLAQGVDERSVPIYCRDSILDVEEQQGPIGASLPFLRASSTTSPALPLPQSFDFVVGNPPWIAWDNLPEAYREATKPLWERYGLFSLSAKAARHGGGKKDLAMLMLHAAADRYLKPGGRLGMVLTQTLLQTKGAGDGFRRFRLGPQGEPLKVVRVDDFVATRPFDDATNWTCTIVLEKSQPTTYPVPYYRWRAETPAASSQKSTMMPDACLAQPVDPKRASSPWLIRPKGLEEALSAIVGPSDYTAYLGANSGGANGVYWIDLLGADGDAAQMHNLAACGRHSLATVETSLERDLLYPLLRWQDVAPYRAVPSAALVLPQDVQRRTGIAFDVMQQRFPRALAYLHEFEAILRERAAYRRYQSRGPFYSMYNVGPYTLAATKVVWRRMDRRIRAAVVEEIHHPILGCRPVIPQETCVLVPADSSDEAHYLCALLNSAVVNFLVASHSVRGGKGFGTPSILDYLNVRRFDPSDGRHTELARRSRQAHKATEDARAGTRDEAQQAIDCCAADLWGLSPSERQILQRELEVLSS